MDEMIGMTRLLMNRSRFQEMVIDSCPLPSAAEGQVVFALDRFSLTVNNITYAAFGEALRYWEFFPTEVAGFGLLPVWGFADVIASRVSGIEPGQRYFGYFPSATHLVVQLGKTGGRSFRDDSAHRRPLPEAYNWYQRVDDDPSHSAGSEPLDAIFRPLYVTAFGLSDFLAEKDFFGAAQVVISSASSRTGYAEPFSIGLHSEIDVVGLTSFGHKGFVEGLGLYSRVLAYEDLEQIDPTRPTVYIDVAGNTEVQLRVHQHFAKQLLHDAALGASHSHSPPQSAADLPGPQPTFFFAPEWLAKRQIEWGAQGLNQRIGKATAAFYAYVTQQRLIDIREQQGLSAARAVLSEMLDGRTNPALGQVIRLRDEAS